MVVIQKINITYNNSTTKITINCVQDLLLQLENCYKNNILSCAEKKRLIADLLLDICEDCAKMATLPQGAFAACKLRENYKDRNLLIARMKSAGDKTDARNLSEIKKPMEYSPAKYNGKLMNSIWGFYNRYSPHNIKGNEYESSEQAYYMQQPIAVASYAIAQNLAMAKGAGNEWRFLEK